jgi:hypothetical protein
VSEPTSGVPPSRIVYSERCRQETLELLARAAARGSLANVTQAIRAIEDRLRWIPLDFGEPLRDLVEMGLQDRLGVVPPLVVRFADDEARRLVYVLLPFEVLRNSGV